MSFAPQQGQQTQQRRRVPYSNVVRIHQRIKSFAEFRSKPGCSSIDVSKNHIQNFIGFEGHEVQHLAQLNLDSNPIRSFEGCKTCPRLTWLSMRNTPISRNKYFKLMCLIMFGDQLQTINNEQIPKRFKVQAVALRSHLYDELYNGRIVSSLKPLRMLDMNNIENPHHAPAEELIEATRTVSYTLPVEKEKLLLMRTKCLKNEVSVAARCRAITDNVGQLPEMPDYFVDEVRRDLARIRAMFDGGGFSEEDGTEVELSQHSNDEEMRITAEEEERDERSSEKSASEEKENKMASSEHEQKEEEAKKEGSDQEQNEEEEKKEQSEERAKTSSSDHEPKEEAQEEEAKKEKTSSSDNEPKEEQNEDDVNEEKKSSSEHEQVDDEEKKSSDQEQKAEEEKDEPVFQVKAASSDGEQKEEEEKKSESDHEQKEEEVKQSESDHEQKEEEAEKFDSDHEQKEEEVEKPESDHEQKEEEEAKKEGSDHEQKEEEVEKFESDHEQKEEEAKKSSSDNEQKEEDQNREAQQEEEAQEIHKSASDNEQNEAAEKKSSDNEEEAKEEPAHESDADQEEAKAEEQPAAEAGAQQAAADPATADGEEPRETSTVQEIVEVTASSLVESESEKKPAPEEEAYSPDSSSDHGLRQYVKENAVQDSSSDESN